jgi:histone H3/H4
MAKKAKASKGGKAKRNGGAEPVLVVSKVKAALRAHDVNVASDAADALNAVCYWYIEQAAKRAAANGRKTVRAHDFMIG